MGSPPVVLLDACVLYPAALRDLLMRLAVHDLIAARWSEKIHEEWMTAVLRTRPDLQLHQLERTRQLMDLHAGDCLVTDYEKHMEGMILPDLNDRHVLAAAIECGAVREAVVSWNVGDFPKTALDVHSIALWTPDDLISRLAEAHPDLILQVMREHRASLKNPPASTADYLEILENQKLRRLCGIAAAWVGEL